MPKMKTNRLAHKKFRVNAKGRAKKAMTNTSHNTGKKSSKRMRRLRGRVMVDKTNERAVKGLLPYSRSAK
ncbi:MAG: 50S ribosomal protein L35 [Bdellovibrionota bacterium]|nr:MAG: 50S ribosomal protein L35 [Bdellovibrionota bacterium]